ncbi:hypothetical protein VHEMI09573 [[Torrubiella] hemipterigena]|uniref:Uncharacterized protein n=1 Tax=[Torrubiella] hemipterigena TaxID=1531966 RepID=A0A0A1TA85_9HYPO|nr:hypothetical protein VHEMI09573 [[Torrubiella] hemipterigena]
MGQFIPALHTKFSFTFSSSSTAWASSSRRQLCCDAEGLPKSGQFVRIIDVYFSPKYHDPSRRNEFVKELTPSDNRFLCTSLALT